MPKVILVDDPMWIGSGPAPQTVRSWAMRKLAEAGTPIGDIARRYGITYHRAYKYIYGQTNRTDRANAVAPKRQSARPSSSATGPASPDSPVSPSRKRKREYSVRERSAAELKAMTKKQLKDAVYTKSLKPGAYADRLQAELDSRFPGWNDEVDTNK